MANQVTLHIKGGLAAFGTIGVDVTPWFTHQPVHIPWGNVMFVSPVHQALFAQALAPKKWE